MENSDMKVDGAVRHSAVKSTDNAAICAYLLDVRATPLGPHMTYVFYEDSSATRLSSEVDSIKKRFR